jgi:hypothetical protein
VGRLAFPTSPLVFAVSSSPSRSSDSEHSARQAVPSAPLDFISTSKRLTERRLYLSVQPPLLAFASPSHRHHFSRLLRIPKYPSDLAKGHHAPSTWFLTTSTVRPRQACESIAPHCQSKVHRVAPSPARHKDGQNWIPAMSLEPSKGFPSSIAVPHHCGLLPSCRYHPKIETARNRSYDQSRSSAMPESNAHSSSQAM